MSNIKQAITIQQISQELRKLTEENQELRKRVDNVWLETRFFNNENQQELYSRVVSLEEGKKKLVIKINVQMVLLILVFVALLANFWRDTCIVDGVTSQINEQAQNNSETIRELNQELTEIIKVHENELMNQIKKITDQSNKNLNEVRVQLQRSIKNAKEKLDEEVQQTSLKFEEIQKVLKPIDTFVSPLIQKQIITNRANVDSWSLLSDKTELDLSSSGLTKLPDQIGSLTQLTRLQLYHNNLREVPNSLCSLPNLQYLNLANNNLMWLPEGMVRLVNLKQLYINNNQLTVLPLQIGKLQQLKALSVHGNKMQVDLDLLIGLKQLKRLFISKDQLQSEQDIIQLEEYCRQREIVLYWFTEND